MDIAYLHVVINHLPIMGVPILLALVLLGRWCRNDSIEHAALLGFVVLGIATVAVFLTGKGGEDFIEHAPGMSEAAIERHEEIATVAFVAVEALALLALFLFVAYGGARVLRRRRFDDGRRIPVAGFVLVLLLGAATSAVLGYTGRLGGKISHTEFSEPGDAATAAEESDDDDGKRRRRRGRD